MTDTGVWNLGAVQEWATVSDDDLDAEVVRTRLLTGIKDYVRDRPGRELQGEHRQPRCQHCWQQNVAGGQPVRSAGGLEHYTPRDPPQRYDRHRFAG